MKTAQLVEQLMKERGLATYYAVAKFLKVTPPTAYRWMRDNTTMDDEVGIRAAEALDLDTGQVLAWLHAERSKSPQERKAWNAIAKRLSQVAVFCFIAVLWGVNTAPVQADPVYPSYTLYAIL